VTESVRAGLCAGDSAASAKASLESVAEFVFKGGQTGINERELGDDDDVKTRRDLVAAEYLSNEPLCFITHNRATEFPGGGNAETPGWRRVPQGEQREKRAVHLDAALVHPLVVGTPAHTFGAPESG
jgi:hypothetical protein